jgi:hypothetical protein
LKWSPVKVNDWQYRIGDSLNKGELLSPSKFEKGPKLLLGARCSIYNNGALMRFTILRLEPMARRSPKFEIVNASSSPHVTDKRNIPLRRSGRGGNGNEQPTSALENSVVLRFARVGNRMISILWLILLAIISILFEAGCC